MMMLNVDTKKGREKKELKDIIVKPKTIETNHIN